jgi:hypothetical protein
MKRPPATARSRVPGTTTGLERTRLADEEVRGLFRRLTGAGFSVAGAGNLSGYAVGLKPMTAAWTTDEITALLFLRELVRRERIVR